MSNVFFIVGFVRSGSTALARIMDTASNAHVSIEREPKLLIESRDAYDGKPMDKIAILRAAHQQAIDEARGEGILFGDKNASYLSFIHELVALWNARIVFFYRDGRDAVRSLMDWHKFKAGNIYIREEDGIQGLTVTPEEDPWSYAYLRPRPEEELYHEWKTLPLFEKCAWYWNEYNRIAVSQLQGLPKENVHSIDLSSATVAHMRAVFEFAGLKGFDPAVVENMLGSRINSLRERTGRDNEFPVWQDWDDAHMQAYMHHARPMMEYFGYSSPQDHL